MRLLPLWLLAIFIPLLLPAQFLSGENQIPVLRCASPNIEAAVQEDRVSGAVPRFAIPVAGDIQSMEEGRWVPGLNGGFTWEILIQSPGALAMIITSPGVLVSDGTFLEVKNKAGQVVEQFHQGNLLTNTAFTIGPVEGDQVYLSYHTPLSQPVPFTLSAVLHAFNTEYRPFREKDPEEMSGIGFASSLECHVNVNCITNASIQSSKNSAVRMLMIFNEGAAWCSAALINNQRQDQTPYILSAFHCQYGNTPQFQNFSFFFRYESPECQNPFLEPKQIKVTGSQLRAKWQNSDFLLLELTQSIPTLVDLTYAGWDRTLNYKPTATFFLHHPQADIKKVSVDSQEAKIWIHPITWVTNGITTPGSHHFRVTFDRGTSEPGSSGGPLFDFNGRIVGQLHGGSADCANNILNFGIFARSWNGGGTPDTRLSNWLDPDNTGVMTLNGLEIEGIQNHSVTGRVVTPTGNPIPNAEVSAGSIMVLTDMDGYFTFESLAAGENYEITIQRDDVHSKGVTVTDVIMLRKALLGTELLSYYAQIAADTNGSYTITISDLILMRKVLVGMEPKFPRAPWSFLKDGPPPSSGSWSITNLSADIMDINFIGVKIGDLNHSYAP